jgi:hypothetical protein
MHRLKEPRLAGDIMEATVALADLERVVAAVKGEREQESTIARALTVLKSLSRKEAIPLAIVGGLGTIHHGYERLTKDIDVVVPKEHLDIITRIAPKYGIKVIWKDPEGWHKLLLDGVNIDVVPEGGKARKDAPTTIPSPRQLGVPEGAGYARLAGWMETKLSSYRVQDKADVVRVMKTTARGVLARARGQIARVHQLYLRRFDELLSAAAEERNQERERGYERR